MYYSKERVEWEVLNSKKSNLSTKPAKSKKAKSCKSELQLAS